MNCNTLLQLEFAEEVYIERVDIYEVLRYSALTCVKAFTDQWVTMWTGTPQTWTGGDRIFSPPIQVCGGGGGGWGGV